MQIQMLWKIPQLRLFMHNRLNMMNDELREALRTYTWSLQEDGFWYLSNALGAQLGMVVVRTPLNSMYEVFVPVVFDHCGNVVHLGETSSDLDYARVFLQDMLRLDDDVVFVVKDEEEYMEF